jgi:hypothetical protein
MIYYRSWQHIFSNGHTKMSPVINRNPGSGSAEPDPKEIFKDPQHWLALINSHFIYLKSASPEHSAAKYSTLEQVLKTSKYRYRRH